MKPENLLPLILLLLFIPACNKGDKPVPGIPEGAVNLSDLETRHDYYLPFALVNDTDIIRLAILNYDTIDFPSGGFIKFDETGFYQLILKYKDTLQPDDTFLFTTMTAERKNSEWGIRSWIPAPYENMYLGPEDVEIYYPHRYTDSIKVPFIFYVRESGVLKPVYCEGWSAGSRDTFNIKQGAGSVNIDAARVSSRMDFVIGGRHTLATVTKISKPVIVLQGTISSGTEIPANSLVSIPNNLEITSTGSLTVDEGTLILIDEAVDINISGPIHFTGAAANPVLVTCSRKNKFWGGFITRVAGGTIDAQYTIFCQSGYHNSDGYNWGHSGRQALFYTENSTLILNHCFILDHIGQIFYPQNSTLTFDDILVQRAQTGGQINSSNLTLRNSIFTDFPDDSYIFEDADNDALYLSASDALIEDTRFMFAKDDGLDSGNEEGGDITLINCRFEACFHEGAALSSANNAVKNHTFTNCVFTNCGQGLELGFSSPDHLVIAENCMFLNNGIGIRYGDNYNWSEVDGKMVIRNSLSLYNDLDVWNMVRMDWSPKLENLSFENTMVSKFCHQYPGLGIKRN